MKSAAYLMKNTLFLTGCSIVIRICTLCFQAYLAGSVGARQLGIFGIISSVCVVFSTISISGVRFGVTRLAAAENSMGNKYPTELMASAFLYAGVFGAISFAVMFFSAPVLSVSYIGDIEAVLPLRIMAAAMPFVSFSACVEGYFAAKQKILRLVLMQITSQVIRILFSVVMLEKFLPKGVFPSDILSASFFVGEGAFAAGMCVLYFAESRKKRGKGTYKPTRIMSLAKTAFPLAVSAYMRTGLSSVGQVIIPSGLKKAGMESGAAFGAYGIITQMALPVIMFPSALLSAMGDVLIPRLTAAQVEGKEAGICYMVNRAMRIGGAFGFGAMGMLFFYAEDIGRLVYKSSEAAFYIKIFAPLIPIIYIDCVTDGCLKGLGQQVYSMMLNVMEGVINVTLLYIFLPKAAIAAYIAVMYIKESFNTVFSLRRLWAIVKIRLSFTVILCIAAATFGAWIMTEIMAWKSIAISLICYGGFYTLLLYLLNTVTREDIRWIISLFSRTKA